MPYDHELRQRLPEGPQSGQGDRGDQEDAGRARALTRIRSIAPIAALLLAACDGGREPPPSQGSTTPDYERVEANASALDPSPQPVRLGENGPAFPACQAVARFRDRVVALGEGVAIRSAPFDQARETGRVAADAEFFICSRTHDQRWLGIVWDDGGAQADACGVAAPVPSRRDYGGPCRSGWVPTALVRFESRIRREGPPEINSTD